MEEKRVAEKGSYILCVYYGASLWRAYPFSKRASATYAGMTYFRQRTWYLWYRPDWDSDWCLVVANRAAL